MQPDLTKATVRELHAALRHKALSSVELTKEYLAAIKKDDLNAFITVNDGALDVAAAADQIIASGKPTVLTGIPFAVKDVIVTKGLRSTAASNMLRDYVPPYTATAVQRLLDAGMVMLGKTNCDEFAMGGSSEHSAFGQVKNPYDSTRVSGGSSGGSAVAVAAGLAPVALGTDTGGSVRLPASFCGVIGFKPTYGRVSRYGLMAMASSLDQVGIFAHTAEDIALLMHAMAGADSHDATASTVFVPDYAELLRDKKPVRIGVPKEFRTGLAGDAAAWFDAALEKCRKVEGVTLVDVSLPHIEYALAVYYIIMPSEVSANMSRYDGLRYGTHKEVLGDLEALYRKNRSAGFGAEVKRRILLGTYALSAGYYDAYYAKAAKVRRLISEDVKNAFQKVDAILGPTSPTPAFKIGEKQSDPLTMYLSDIYTVAANLAGLPAVSFPAGEIQGLPMGLQLMGPAWSEGSLLELVERLGASTA